MSLVFAAMCPHPPILIPSIGKENLKKIRKTKNAMEYLTEIFYHRGAETVIIITPHTQIMADSFVINHSPVLKMDFSDFGDLDTKASFKNDLGLAYQIKESVETKIPLILSTEEVLDHGCGIPLYYLAKGSKNVAVVPVSYSLLDYSRHFEFGRAIKQIIFSTNKKIAVVASGDLSHCLTPDSPAGYSPQGKVFDKKLISLLKQNNSEEIINLDCKLVEEAAECGFRSLLILLGILDKVSYKTELLSYQSPFGVGYLTALFKF